MEFSALILVIGATFCWGSAQVIGKLALRNISALVFNTVRFSVAATIITLGAIFFGSGGSIEFGLPLFSAIASGVLAWFVATFLFFYVLKRDTAHRIIPAGNSYPFWAILFSALLLGENITLIIPVSAVLVFGGTFLLSRRQKGEGDGWKFGVPVASFVAFLWGLNAVFNKFALEEGMVRSSLLWVRIVTAVILFWIVFALKSIKQRPNFHRRSIGLSVLSGSIAFPLGSFFYVWALSMENASVLAPVTGGTILFGFILSVIFLEESPTRKALGGMLAIFSGILLMAL